MPVLHAEPPPPSADRRLVCALLAGVGCVLLLRSLAYAPSAPSTALHNTVACTLRGPAPPALRPHGHATTTPRTPVRSATEWAPNPPVAPSTAGLWSTSQALPLVLAGCAGLLALVHRLAAPGHGRPGAGDPAGTLALCAAAAAPEGGSAMSEPYTVLVDAPGELLATAQREKGPGWAAQYGPLLLLTLGHKAEACLPVAQELAAMAPDSILLADCYGLLGYSPAAKANVELMEKGCGQEYGGVGGEGGSGVLLVAFPRPALSLTTAEAAPPKSGVANTAWLLITPDSDSALDFAARHALTPYFGGVAKQTYQFDRAAGRWAAVPFLFVGNPQGLRRLALSTFSGDGFAAECSALAEALPRPRICVAGLFPCFMRGINKYDRTGVEVAEAEAAIPGLRVYGMFCHGELGPPGRLGLVTGDRVDCSEHSEVTILALHA